MFGLSVDAQVIIFLIALFVLMSVLFYKNLASKSKYKGGGGFLTTMAATYELQSKDQRAAIQEIVEVNAHKKMEEQESSDTNPEGIIKDE